MRFRLAPKEQCVLRSSRRDDSSHVAELIVLAGDQRPDFPYLPDPSRNGPIDLSRPRAARRDESFALRHATLAEFSDRVAGMILGYKLSRNCEALKPNFLGQCLRPIMDPEPDLIDAFYVNTLAIYPAYQKHGLGARLLDWAEQRALKKNCTGLCLEVCEHNERAVRFYRRCGFEVSGRRAGGSDYPEPYDRDVAFLWRPLNR
jgi:ribosomal protein S18 acetylase RimI-like enzyme